MPVVSTIISTAILEAIAVSASEVIVAGLTAGEILSGVISIGLSFGLSELGQLIEGTPDKPKPHSSRENFRNPLAPRVRYYGRVKIGGPYAFLKVGPIADYGQENPNALYQVIALGQGEFDGLEEYWLADAHVTLDGDEWPDGWVAVPKNFTINQGQKYVMLRFHSGTRFQDADSFLTLNWPTQWTGDFLGLEIPYVVMAAVSPAAENFNKVFPAGLPTVSTVCRSSKVWDPRANGQSPYQPSTWTFSSNGARIVLDAVWNAAGLGLPLDMLWPAIGVWKSEINRCAFRRYLKNGGSEYWYRLAGGYELTQPPKSWLSKMLDPMDARLALRADGAIVLNTGRWRTPVLTISDADIVSYTNMSRGKQKADVRNRIEATFVSPDYNYVSQQADPVLNEDSIDIDGEQSMSLDLDWAPSNSQARYRMKIEAARQDPSGWCGTIVTKAYGLKFLVPYADGTPQRFINLVISELGIDGSFEIAKFSFDPKNGNCQFTVVAMSADAFDWNMDDEGTAPGRAKDTSASGVEDPFNLEISVTGASIHASIDPPLNKNLDLTLVLDSRRTNDSVGDDQAVWQTFAVSDWAGSTGNLPNGFYDIRARLHNSTPDWSDPLLIRGIRIQTQGDLYAEAALGTEAGEALGTEGGAPLGEE